MKLFNNMSTTLRNFVNCGHDRDSRIAAMNITSTTKFISIITAVSGVALGILGLSTGIAGGMIGIFAGFITAGVGAFVVVMSHDVYQLSENLQDMILNHSQFSARVFNRGDFYTRLSTGTSAITRAIIREIKLHEVVNR